MPARKKWKVVTADGEKTGLRSENKTYEWLREWAAQQPDGAEANVYVQEFDRWLSYDKLVVRNSLLSDA